MQQSQRFGGRREPFRNGKKFTTNKAREERSDRDNWRKPAPEVENKKATVSNKLKINNLNNSISNEDLNVLFRNIGPLEA